MGVAQLGWFYFDGQLRYKDAHGWTERYKPIDGPRAGTAPATEKTLDAKADKSRRSKRPSKQVQPRQAPRRRVAHLVTVVCAGLLGLGLGGGWLKPDLVHGNVSWVTVHVGQAQKAPAGPSIDAFALGGPAPATVPANYSHPSPAECLKFRDQLRAWSQYQNAHRPTGFVSLPSASDLQFLTTSCGLSY
ncbi:MAG: hypothetical protein ABI438_08520 [Dermatophilaceae bacterium]